MRKLSNLHSNKNLQRHRVSCYKALTYIKKCEIFLIAKDTLMLFGRVFLIGQASAQNFVALWQIQ